MEMEFNEETITLSANEMDKIIGGEENLAAGDGKPVGPYQVAGASLAAVLGGSAITGGFPGDATSTIYWNPQSIYLAARLAGIP